MIIVISPSSSAMMAFDDDLGNGKPNVRIVLKPKCENGILDAMAKYGLMIVGEVSIVCCMLEYVTSVEILATYIRHILPQTYSIKFYFTWPLSKWH